MKLSNAALKLTLLCACVAGLIALTALVDVRGRTAGALEWIDAQGALGMAAFILLYVVAAVCLVPGSLLTLGAGAIYGLPKGLACVSVASTLGACAAFFVGRYLARGWIASKIGSNPKFRAIDEAVAKEGWKIVGLTRLSPVLPYTLLNYAYGTTRVSFLHYFLASWIGMLPGTVLYVYIGSAAGGLSSLGSDRGRTPAELALLAVGLIATLAVTIFITRMARRALNQRIDFAAANTEN
ncbi:MAG: TVP38/TMEM64 family protein [Candidatus Hydrogenedentota bacterium]